MLCSGGDDHGRGGELPVVRVHREQFPFLRNGVNAVYLELRTELAGLFFELLGQLDPRKGFGKSGIVLQIVDDEALTARGQLLQKQGVEIGPRGVLGRGQAGCSRSDDDEVFVCSHVHPSLPRILAAGNRQRLF